MLKFLNNWSATLLAPLTAEALSMSVDAGEAAKLTGLGSGDHYLLTLSEADSTGQEIDWEIVKVTANVGGTLTIERNQESSGARPWPTDTPVSIRLTAGGLVGLGQSTGGSDQVGDWLTSSATPGAGWLAADGSAKAKSTYPALHAVLGDRLARLRRSAVLRSQATGTPGPISKGGGVYLLSFPGTNQLMRSADGGTTWSAVALVDGSGTSVLVNGLTYGAGVFVAVGSSGRIGYSADGRTWTLATSPFSSTVVRGVTFAAGLFVAVADSGKLATSPDGANWTLRTSQFGTSAVLGVAYSVGRFVIVGAAGKVAYSADGETWTLGTSGSSSTLNAVGAVAGGFVTYDSSLAYTSSDGNTWTSNTPGIGAHDAFVASGGRVLLSGSTVLETTDGVTWTPFSNPLPGGIDVLAFFDDGVLEIVGGGNATYFFRPAGGAWARRFNLAGTSDISAIAHGAGKYVAISTSGDLVVSTDAVTWTRVETTATVAAVSAVYGNGLFVVGCTSGRIMTSADAETWTVTTLSGVTGSAGVTAFGGGRFAIIFGNTCASSADGATWTLATVTGGGTALLAYGAGRWVLTTNSSIVMTSPDAITWTTHFDVMGRPTALAFGNGWFVAVDSARVHISREGLSWEVVGPAPPEALHLAFGDGVFVLVCAHPKVYTSEDGERWEGLLWSFPSEDAPAPKRVLAAGGRALIAGTGGYLATYTPDFNMSTHFVLPLGGRRDFIKAL
ncbi:tail fiber protein [Pseudomonas sp. LFM046]|uniref:tail fiber protein n=1 Tax=Pseudomonas sp. LFM046 TaxID=1608357 RepID=UPI0005CFEBC9|nr:tail fiber protein [Pseudomonas sp. LFM046]